nr:STAS domain-containing protein [Saccharothrix mutabilis subsp. capreolus]
MLRSGSLPAVDDHPDPTEPGALRIDRRVLDGALVLAVAGEVDLDSVEGLAAALTDAVDRGPCEVVVADLSTVTFLGSIGLTALLEATRRADAAGRSLHLVVDANRPVIRPIEITGLDLELTLFHTVEEALHGRAR